MITKLEYIQYMESEINYLFFGICKQQRVWELHMFQHHFQRE